MSADVSKFSGLRLATDVSAAQWVADRLWPQAGSQLQVGNFVPDIFACYGRLLHPARSTLAGDNDDIRWASIATEKGIQIDSESRFRDLVDWQDGPAPPPPYDAPLRGSLDEPECLALAEILVNFTSSSQLIWYCFWSGYGWPELPPPEQGAPRVHLEHEDCVLFTGSITASTNFRSSEWFQSPTIWWPDDHAWCVSTPVDGFSTYIGGSEALLSALLDHSRLEILPIQVGQPVDPSPYPASY